MKLLLDQNVSHRLKPSLEAIWPEIAHVREFEPDARPTLLDMADMADALSVLVRAPVDLRTAADLSRCLAEQVLQEAEVQFVAA